MKTYCVIGRLPNLRSLLIVSMEPSHFQGFSRLSNLAFSVMPLFSFCAYTTAAALPASKMFPKGVTCYAKFTRVTSSEEQESESESKELEE